jgi:hypothetical protein
MLSPAGCAFVLCEIIHQYLPRSHVMKDQIESILAGVPHEVTQVKDLWRINVGEHVGARKDGVSLAHDLLALHNYKRPPMGQGERIAHPEPSVSGEEMRGAAPEAPATPEPPTVIEKTVEVEKIVENPETQERLAEALRKLSEANAKLEEKRAYTGPPPECADEIDWSAPPKERQEALLAKLRPILGEIGLAEDRGGRAAPALYRKRDVLESGIRYNRAVLAETI